MELKDIVRENLFSVLNFYLDKNLSLLHVLKLEKKLDTTIDPGAFENVQGYRFESYFEINGNELEAMNLLGIIPKNLENALRQLANEIFTRIPSDKCTVGLITSSLEKEKEQELDYPSDTFSAVFKESGLCVYVFCYGIEKETEYETLNKYNMSLIMDYKLV